MTIIGIKKIEAQIVNKSISTKAYITYAFISIGSLVQLLKTSKYPVNISAYSIAEVLGIVLIGINILKYIMCYYVVREKSITDFAYAAIPIEAVITIRYTLFITIPLALINFLVIRYFKLDFNYWNIVNSQIISVIYLFINASSFLILMNRVIHNK